MTTGVLPYRTFKDRVLDNTGFFECSTTDTYTAQGTSSGNHDSAGMSMGNLQYNFGSANRLTELWQFMINNHEQDCIDAFGANTTEYNTWKTAVMSTVQQDRLNFGANITDPNNSHAVIQPYKDVFMVLGNKQSHIDKYKSMADAYYFPVPELFFLTSSATSRLAYASIFDAYINKGRFYPANLITADFDRIDADTTIDATEKERQKIYQINYRTNYDNAVSPTVPSGATQSAQQIFWDGDNVAGGRRGCMANQSGTYYGLAYNPNTQFDMNEEPGMSQKAATTGINIGGTAVSKVFLGETQINKIYKGSALMGGQPTATTSSAVPKTQFRTNPGSYAGVSGSSVTLNAGDKLWVDVLENPTGSIVACRTYYTTDGTDPTTSSPKYTDALTFNASCTLKTLTVSTSGVAEAIKTLTITIASAKPTYKYLQILGYGCDVVGSEATTRVIELEVMSGGVNRMSAATMLSGDAPNNTGTIAQIKDGVKTTASNSYPLWWTTVPNAHVIIDLGAQYAIDSMSYYSVSITGDQRTNKFIIQGSNTNNGTDWVNIWDNSTGQLGKQPILPSGYTVTF